MDSNKLVVNPQNGKITITSTYGDVSDDGQITAYDASLVFQHIVGLIELSPDKQDVADVTGDGEVSALDAAMILQYTVGLIKEFPRQQPSRLLHK